jgi:hypothetical protein
LDDNIDHHHEQKSREERNNEIMKLKGSYDFYLILATTMVLFAICLITIYGMFYFKFAQIQQMAPAIKLSYMNRMNTIVAPFVICLILLLGICVPKRLLPTAWLNRVTMLMVFGAVLTGIFAGVRAGIFLILGASLVLQLIVLVLALAGSKNLNFQKKGYWVRLGSSLIHLGLILFVFDNVPLREKSPASLSFLVYHGSHRYRNGVLLLRRNSGRSRSWSKKDIV